MEHRSLGKLSFVFGLLLSLAAHAQSTSRMVPFSGVATTLQPFSQQNLGVELWDQPIAGTRISAEVQPNVNVDANGQIDFLYGLPSGGLNPNDFPSGASRFLDVIDPATGSTVLPSFRIPLFAAPFALSPGPAGPPGPTGATGATGATGQQGPPGRPTFGGMYSGLGGTCVHENPVTTQCNCPSAFGTATVWTSGAAYINYCYLNP